MGFDYLTHSPGVAENVAKDPSKWKNELDLYADMDEAKAQELIKLMLQHKVTLIPNFLNIAVGYAKDWRRFEAEDLKVLSDPNVLAFYPEATVLGRPTALTLLRRGSRLATGDPAVLERRRQGYLNLMRFHLDYVRAGGRVLTGGNTQVQKVAGMTILHEMEAFIEGGFTPMGNASGGHPMARGGDAHAGPRQERSKAESWLIFWCLMPIRSRISIIFEEARYAGVQRQSHGSEISRLAERSFHG